MWVSLRAPTNGFSLRALCDRESGAGLAFASNRDPGNLKQLPHLQLARAMRLLRYALKDCQKPTKNPALCGYLGTSGIAALMPAHPRPTTPKNKRLGPKREGSFFPRGRARFRNVCTASLIVLMDTRIPRAYASWVMRL